MGGGEKGEGRVGGGEERGWEWVMEEWKECVR